MTTPAHHVASRTTDPWNEEGGSPRMGPPKKRGWADKPCFCTLCVFPLSNCSLPGTPTQIHTSRGKQTGLAAPTFPFGAESYSKQPSGALFRWSVLSTSCAPIPLQRPAASASSAKLARKRGARAVRPLSVPCGCVC